MRHCVCALAVVCLPTVVHTACSAGANRFPIANAPDFLYLVPDSAMASATASAQNAWNSCVSNNRQGFPYPTQTPF